MNAPLHLLKEMEQDVPYKSTTQLDKKRYLWLISPFLPVLGMGILAGYQFAPKPAKKVFALGGPLLLHLIIPTIDTLIGQDANNPSNLIWQQNISYTYSYLLILPYLFYS